MPPHVTLYPYNASSVPVVSPFISLRAGVIAVQIHTRGGVCVLMSDTRKMDAIKKQHTLNDSAEWTPD